MKAIGVKMVDIMPMSVSMALEHGYRVGNANPNDMGYEVTYPDGYKSWCPKDVTITGYECHGLSACVDANNYNREIGEKFALEKAKDAIWQGLGFVLQWAKFGLKRD